MPRYKAFTKYMLWIMIGLTCANLAFHAVRADEREDHIPVGLEVGDALPSLNLRRLGFPPDSISNPELPSGCRLLVAFSISCPYCEIAAVREIDRSVADRLPIVYISKTDGKRMREFMTSLGSPVEVWYGDDAFRKLRVEAVPAAILVSSDNVVKKAFGYLGDEDHTKLREQC